MAKIKSISTLALLALTLSPSSLAAPVNLTFTGLFDAFASGGLGNATPIATPIAFSMSINYDDSEIGSPLMEFTNYVDVFSGNLNLGGTDITLVGGDILIINDATNLGLPGSPLFSNVDAITFQAEFLTPADVLGETMERFTFTFADGDATFLNSFDLPSSLAPVDDYEHQLATLDDQFLFNQYVGTVTSISSVPLPASGLLFMSALGGLLLKRINSDSNSRL